MYFGGTQLICVATISIEVVILLFQLIHLLERPDDKNRLWYLFLLIFLLSYNVCTALFPSPDIPIPEMIQTVLAFGIVFLMAMYIVFYFYKAYHLSGLRFFATYGLLIFIFAPYVFLFVVPYYLTRDVDLSRKWAVIIPGLYGAVFVFYVLRAFLTKFREGKNNHPPNEEDTLRSIVPASIALLCWASVPVIIFFSQPELEMAVVNLGFLIITISYIRLTILKSKREYSNLQRRTHTMTSFAYETEPTLLLIDHYLHDFKERYGANESAEKLEILTANLERMTSGLRNFKLVTDQHIYNQPTNISLLIKTKIFVLDTQARQKDIEIVANIVPNLFLRDYTASLDRVVNMLFESAIRSAQENGTVEITLVAEDSNAILSVIDNGIKISVTLPGHVAAGPLTAERQQAPAMAKRSLRRPHILIVENNGFSLDSLANQLEEYFTVNVASSRTEALEKLKGIGHLDLIITDITAEAMGDDQFRQEVNANEKFKGTPFLFLTDQKFNKVSSGPIKFDSFEYIEKPVVMTELKGKIDALIVTINNEKEMLREVIGSMRKTPSSSTDAAPQPFTNAFEYNCWKCGLTPREIEIVRLLNLGRSHKKIGEKLFISKKTVDTHVGNIFTKVREAFDHTDVAGRVELLNILEVRSSTVDTKPD